MGAAFVVSDLCGLPSWLLTFVGSAFVAADSRRCTCVVSNYVVAVGSGVRRLG